MGSAKMNAMGEKKNFNRYLTFHSRCKTDVSAVFLFLQVYSKIQVIIQQRVAETKNFAVDKKCLPTKEMLYILYVHPTAIHSQAG
jgi:hypothetical protein